MEDWLSYRLSDLILFSPRAYYSVFAQYHAAIWPAQVVIFASALAIVWLARRGDSRTDRLIAGVLAGWWLWVAVMFHAARYSSINWAARYFALLFILQSVLLLWRAATGDREPLRTRAGRDATAAAVLLACALVLAPLGSLVAGREWNQVELIGATPDPTAIATLAFAIVSSKGRLLLAIVPLLWCAIGAGTLWALDSLEAWIPIACGIGSLVLLTRRPRPA